MKTGRRKKVIWGVLFLTVCVLSIFFVFKALETKEFESMVTWFQHHELSGGIIYILCFAGLLVLCCPSTLFEMIAGYIFGFWWGVVVATTGKVLGCCVCFFLGRFLFRERVVRQMEEQEESTDDDSMEEGEQGKLAESSSHEDSLFFRALRTIVKDHQFRVVMLTRLAFFPIALKNYGLSVLDVSFSIFLFSSISAGVLFTTVWAYTGHTAKHIASLISGNSRGHKKTEIIVMAVGATFAVVLLFSVGIYARKYMLTMARNTSESNHVYETEDIIKKGKNSHKSNNVGSNDIVVVLE